LVKTTGKGKNTILRSIYWFLDHPPKTNPTPNKNCRLIIDATWFGRNYCLLIYWDTDIQKVQLWRVASWERFEEISEDLGTLRTRGVILVSATSDGGKGVKLALEEEYPNIPHQRCLVHLQRLSLALITKNPRSHAGWEARQMALFVSRIRTRDEKDKWISYFENWCRRWEKFLKERTFSEDKKKWWYTHKSLRRLRGLIVNATPKLFYFLDDGKITKDTNGLEGRFSSFKQHYRQHRGLSKKRREAYIAWYITVVINKELPTRNGY